MGRARPAPDGRPGVTWPVTGGRFALGDLEVERGGTIRGFDGDPDDDK